MKECVGWAGIKTPHAHPPTRKPATHAPDTHSPLPISLQQRSSASPSGCLERVPPRNGFPRVLESQALSRPLALTGGRDGAPGGSLVSPKSSVAFFPCRPILSIAHCLCLHNSIPLVPYLLPASPFVSSRQSHLVTINNLTFTLSTFTFLYRFDDLQTVLAKPFHTLLDHIVAANSNL